MISTKRKWTELVGIGYVTQEEKKKRTQSFICGSGNGNSRMYHCNAHVDCSRSLRFDKIKVGTIDLFQVFECGLHSELVQHEEHGIHGTVAGFVDELIIAGTSSNAIIAALKKRTELPAIVIPTVVQIRNRKATVEKTAGNLVLLILFDTIW